MPDRDYDRLHYDRYAEQERVREDVDAAYFAAQPYMELESDYRPAWRIELENARAYLGVAREERDGRTPK